MKSESLGEVATLFLPAVARPTRTDGEKLAVRTDKTLPSPVALPNGLFHLKEREDMANLHPFRPRTLAVPFQTEVQGNGREKKGKTNLSGAFMVVKNNV